jgi:mannitol/fructose-specific phosphotransferase system IIA component (Ntr-type)
VTLRLGDLTRKELIFPDLSALDRAGILREMADRIEALGLIDSAQDVAARLLERERLGSTGIGAGIAIPHCKVDRLREPILALGIARHGVEFEAGDGQSVQLFFLLVSPTAAAAQHLQMLAAISRWVRSGGKVDDILALDGAEAIHQYLLNCEG